MIRRLYLGLLPLSATLFASAADDPTDSLSPRFAVVDMEQLFAAHPATDAATEELSQAREAIRDAFKKESETLAKILQRHQELIRADKQDEAAEQLKKANEAEKAIATLRTTRERDIEQRFRESKREIMKEIRLSVAAFNADGRYALVFDRSSSSPNGLPHVVHAPGAEDITEAVLEFMKESEWIEREKSQGEEP